MYSAHSIKYVLVICLFALQGSAGTSTAYVLGPASYGPQTRGSEPSAQLPGRGTQRRSQTRRRLGRRGRRLTISDSTANITSDIEPPGDGQAISAPTNDNTPLSETLDYIQLRMKDYGAQTGYSGGEVLKDVTFPGCPRSQGAAPTDLQLTAPAAGETDPQPPENCSISWVITFKDSGDGASDLTRTVTLKLKDLRPGDGTIRRQGVIWVRTTPYRSITVTTAPGSNDPIAEDEWWIDLHDTEVAERVALALQHAAEICRGKDYVEKFTSAHGKN